MTVSPSGLSGPTSFNRKDSLGPFSWAQGEPIRVLSNRTFYKRPFIIQTYLDFSFKFLFF